MTAPIAWCEGMLAAFALHALWQVPLLAAAAWCAVRIGRPHVRVAYALWVGTLVLCVSLPLFSTVAGRHAAWRAERDAAAASISFDAADYEGQLPALQREAAWQRLLHRHINSRDGLQPFAFAISQHRARVLACAYLLLAAGFLLQLALAWKRMRVLVRRSSPAALPVGFHDILRLYCEQLQLPALSLRLSSDIAGPALAGVFAPVLLLPEGSLAQMEPTEWNAVLLHELAHLRRHDPLMHAACSLLLLPVAFHPAAWWVSRCIRQTREIACDAEAAARMGSRSAYARSLLRIAERTGLQQHGSFPRGFFSNGLFGAGLELFNRSGAMEERMQMLVKSRQPEARGRRAVRIAACVSLGTVAVLAAGMLQVRPALAGERTGQQVTASAGAVPAASAQEGAEAHLLSGDHAREQLRQARRQLDKAEQQATNDEDRRKISTARGIAAAAESAMANVNSASRGLEVQVDLSQLQTQLSGLKVPDIDISLSHLTPEQEAYLQSPEWKAKIEKQRAYFNSPEWKANIEKQRAYFDSPEWKANIARQKAYFNSPEWKERTEKQKEAALAAARARMDSPEWKQQIETASHVDAARMAEIARDARQQAERAMKQMRSAQRQMADGTRLMAHNDGPPPMTFGNTAADPLKVPSNVMAGNNLTKKVPVYPAEAKEKKMQGEVLLHAIISEAGKVEQLSVISSPDKMFSASAIEAVQEWTYKPYLLNGQPIAVDTTITVHYSLTQ